MITLYRNSLGEHSIIHTFETKAYQYILLSKKFLTILLAILLSRHLDCSLNYDIKQICPKYRFNLYQYPFKLVRELFEFSNFQVRYLGHFSFDYFFNLN